MHWSSTKCKKVTKSVLASEIYKMVHGFDIGFYIAQSLQQITKALKNTVGKYIPKIPLVFCTDSYSLYKAITKLGTTAEKRLIIDIITIRQSYERREL